ncbi:MAG: hypothetical protein ACRD0L_00180, partial [Acidimicrobiales bacterium]
MKAEEQAGDAGSLAEERDRALRALVDLDRERLAGEMDEASYQALRDEHTSRAAAAIRGLSRLAGGPAAPGPASAAAPGPA